MDSCLDSEPAARVGGTPEASRLDSRPTIMTTLYVRNQDDFRAATESDILTQARDVISQHYRRGAAVLADERLTADYLQIHLVDFHHEVFGLIHLDARNRLIAVEHLFRGTLTGANVYPREVVRFVIQHGSAGWYSFTITLPVCRSRSGPMRPSRTAFATHSKPSTCGFTII